MNNVNHCASTLTEPSDSVNERFVERALESIYSYIDLQSLMWLEMFHLIFLSRDLNLRMVGK